MFFVIVLILFLLIIINLININLTILSIIYKESANLLFNIAYIEGDYLLNDEYNYIDYKDNITNIINLADNNTSDDIANLGKDNDIADLGKDPTNTGKDNNNNTASSGNEKDIPRKLADPNKPNPQGWEYENDVEEAKDWVHMGQEDITLEEQHTIIKEFIDEFKDKVDPTIVRILTDQLPEDQKPDMGKEWVEKQWDILTKNRKQ